MRNLNNELKDRLINYDKLLEYGFINQDNEYIYKTKIYQDKFEIIVIFSDNKNISKLIDIENNEEYILVDIKDSVGAFVGQVREEYENKIQDIITNCTTSNIYKSNQAKEIIKYIKDKYNNDLEFLWERLKSKNAIWRNKVNNKWYAALLIVSERKLGIDSDEEVEIIDLLYQKDKIRDIVDNNKVYPGYHMNKDSWITIKLDNTVDIETIYTLIDNSYNISLEKK